MSTSLRPQKLLINTALLLLVATTAMAQGVPQQTNALTKAQEVSLLLNAGDEGPAPLGGGVPANNTCLGATVEPLTAGGTLVRTGDNTGATSGGGISVPAVWEGFTISECLDVVISYCGTTPPFDNLSTQLNRNCPLNNLASTATANVTDCGDGNFQIFFPQMTAGTYYYPVLATAGSTGPYQLTITGAACNEPAPPNDDCPGAIVLFPNPTCVPVLGDVNGATESLPAIPCAGFTGIANTDVWYSFTATSEEHTIIVQPSTFFSATVDLRTGTCASSTSIACSDNFGQGGTETLEVSGLTIGETYYVRVNDWYAGLPITTVFNICIIGPASDECQADAGSLTADQEAPCLENGTAQISASPAGQGLVPPGFEVVHVLTQGEDLVILATAANPSFEVNTPGLFTIHTLVFDPLTLDLSGVEPGVTTGFEVNALLIQGGGEICASLDVDGAAFLVEEDCDVPCEAFAGTSTPDQVEPCFTGGVATFSATPNGDAVIPEGYLLVYGLTQGDELILVQGNDLPEFQVTEPGEYRIHALVFDPATLDLDLVEFGVTTGADLAALLIQGGGEICASLDVAGAAFIVTDDCPCLADAGTLSPDQDAPCLEDGPATLSATTAGNPNVPDGFAVVYVLTQGEELVIIAADAAPSFEVDAPGLYTIHTLVFDPATLDLSIVEPGVTTGFDVNALLIQGGGEICASLDVAGAAFNVTDDCPCLADAGTLSPDQDAPCLEDGPATLSATTAGNANVPDGFAVVYVLTQGEELVIIDAGEDASFEVDAPGLYTIHTLVFDPATLDLSIVEPGVTTGFDVNALLIQGGGEICASLDVAGAAFNVTDDCPCLADAGTLSPDQDAPCLEDGPATLSATTAGNANVPDGFAVVYVLTQGEELVIIDAGEVASFEVDAPGLYTIHTLVFDPATLDLSIVEPGVTTGFDVNALLIQGGGEICASLDVAGAAFNVTDDCPCLADAGTLSPDQDAPCLEDGPATLSATIDVDPNVPDGFAVVYVLTQGEELVIIAADAAPSFEVDAPGLYTIHTLVFDPATLDLSIVEPGVTTGFDVNALLIQGGGEICASLDVEGAAFNVTDDCPCLANAGTLSPDQDAPCLEDGPATLSATIDVDPNVPDGFAVVYVLTQGEELVIIAADAAPSFEVDAPGLYTIHTLVFDPATLDLSIVEPGVTTGFDVNALLIQGGGEICASLDVAGAAFTVTEECEDLCLADAGTLSTNDMILCLEEGVATITAIPNGDANVPPGFSVLYALTTGNEAVIIGASVSPQFVVTEEGPYTVHTLVYDPFTLDPGIIILGTTTGPEVAALLIQGGGDICASLDLEGASVQVEICSGIASQGPQAAMVVPVNGGTALQVTGADLGGSLLLELFDASGRRVMNSRATAASGTATLIALPGNLGAGSYIVRIIAGEQLVMGRFVMDR